MSRDSSGNYSLPATYNPVVSGTTILSLWGNTTLTDIGSELTSSVDRSGRGAMLAPFKAFDGNVGAPGITFGNETTLGIYRSAAGVMSFAVGGSSKVSISASGLVVSAFGVSAAGPVALTVSDTLDSTAVYLGADATGGYDGTSTNHPYRIRSNALDRIVVASTGGVSVNTPTSGTALTLNGVASTPVIALVGTGLRFTTDMDNATVSNRFAFMPNVTNANGQLIIIPNGSGTQSEFLASNATDAGNAATLSLRAAAAECFVSATKAGTGSFLPLNLYTSNTLRLSITAAGVVTVADLAGTLRNVGLLESPINTQNANYTAVLTDSAKTIYHTDANPYTWKLPRNANVNYNLGTIISFVQGYSANGTITIDMDATGGAADTLVFEPGGSTTTPRTLAAGGRCTAQKVESTRWVISGVGLS